MLLKGAAVKLSLLKMSVVAACGFLMLAGTLARAADVLVAVAANFTAPAREIADKFTARTGQTVDLSFGASGQLYTQISQGAPYDIFLSADSERAKKAETDSFAAPGARFTYAIGKLVLWSANPALVDKDGAVLKKSGFAHIAIANPTAAPYGAAAVEAMNALGIYKSLESKFVTGENINQTFQFVASGNAELGFVALSQVVDQKEGSSWLVPDNLYSPIVQDGVLLKQGEKNAAARAFYAFLKSPEALKIIQRYGYAVPSGK
jgi:molybdate transport system substrate-binding protein